MGDIIKLETGIVGAETDDIIIRDEHSLMDTADKLLTDIRAEELKNTSLSMPLAELATLGAGVSSLLPALRTVTQTTTIAADGLFRVANAADGVLKANKTGEFFWGALKAADGTSKLAKLTPAGDITTTAKTVAAVNPAIMMVAVALYCVEKKLGEIAETQEQILSFLENEKEAEVEADLQTISGMISDYKHNWDNERYIASNHKMALDIQRKARSHMIFCQKEVADAVSSKKHIVAQGKVKSAKEELVRKFKYYRLSLFTFSMSSLLEVMLSGNFKEEYIAEKKKELEARSVEYRELFSKCSEYLEKLGKSSIEAVVLKGGGKALDTAGKLVEKIPVIERGSVDEFLRDSGAKIQKSGESMENRAVGQFAEVSNPGIRVFIEKLDDLIRISSTAEICVDGENIYLLAE